jgi:predicted transcriptional regulator of viral defense system
MRFSELLDIAGDDPVFSSSLLRAGDVNRADVASQLSRWVASGRLISLRRGVYALAAPFRRREPHAFEIANLLVRPSYVSLESALSFHGLIPEAVFTTTSVTRARTAEYETPLGTFSYRSISEGLFWGYTSTVVTADGRHTAFVARPEKALLDLVHMRPGGDAEDFLAELRLDRLDTLDLDLLHQYAERSGKPKLLRAVERITRMAEAYESEWVTQ